VGATLDLNPPSFNGTRILPTSDTRSDGAILKPKDALSVLSSSLSGTLLKSINLALRACPTSDCWSTMVFVPGNNSMTSSSFKSSSPKSPAAKVIPVAIY